MPSAPQAAARGVPARTCRRADVDGRGVASLTSAPKLAITGARSVSSRSSLVRKW